jgi:imidazoleglycerol-phosphate dehydratase
MRKHELSRETRETSIQAAIELDGTGEATVNTGVGFFDHMLVHLAHHGRMNLRVEAKGDLHIDAHHTVEDIGICLGQAFRAALGEPRGIARFGHAVIPMDEALAEATVDVSGRPFLVFRADIPKVKLGDFDAELAEEFMRAFAMHSKCTVHLELRYAGNVHHAIEVMFKAFARALAAAVAKDDRVEGIPSTKGVLEA